MNQTTWAWVWIKDGQIASRADQLSSEELERSVAEGWYRQYVDTSAPSISLADPQEPPPPPIEKPERRPFTFKGKTDDEGERGDDADTGS